MQNKNSLKFSVDSQLMGELGEKLVTKNYIALSELIKNAYDADADNVTIRFIDAGDGGSIDNDSEIQVIDDGVGLAFEDVKRNWMRIATTYKVSNPVSSFYGRFRTGNKGIGRFACQKLSRRLELETTAEIGESRFETTKVVFDWKEFKPGSNLTDIPCEYETRRSRSGETGFILRLINLREHWTQRDFNMLRRQTVLLSVQRGSKRKGYIEDPGFEINIDAPEFESGEGILLEQFMNAGWGKLEGKVLADGTIKLTLDGLNIGIKKYEFPDRYKSLKGVAFEIAWIPQEPESYRDRKSLTKNVAEKLREWGGVKVYLDGFRIYPYGGPKDDWLGIDIDVARRKAALEHNPLISLAKKLHLDHTRVLLLQPRHRSLIGRVFIDSEKADSFVVKMDREGLVQNEAYDDLVDIVKKSINWMTVYYAVYRRRAAKQKKEEAFKEFVASSNLEKTDSSKLVDKAINVLSGTAKDRGQLKEIKQTLSLVRQAEQVIKTKIKDTDAELAVLRSVASTGPLMFVFAHEVKGTIAALNTHALYIENLLSKVSSKHKNELMEMADSLRNSSHRFNQLSRLFGVFSAAKSLDKKRFFLLERLDVIKSGFAFIVKEFKIDFDISCISENIKTPRILEAELYSILVNLITNSIKALIAGNGKKIKVEASIETGFVMTIMDDGVGLAEKYWVDVFEPLTIDPDNKIYSKLSIKLGDKDLSALGKGTGLGLSIVKGIIESNGGSVAFVKPSEGWSSCVRVELP
ncbi:MAG: sensor histidine kinase [Candidatus Thiodiazotropha endolucinida]